MQAASLGDAAIRDTVAAVFRQPVYNRTTKLSLLARLLEWIDTHILDRLRAAAADSPSLYWTMVAVFAVVLGAIAARALYAVWLRRLRDAEARGRAGGHGARGRARDPWLAAQELAAAGNFTDAAHALYRALLEAVARRERLRLHPSKTIGDYARELRARSSAAFGRFRDFTRSYETVVYGIGSCDRERYERLRALAAPIIQANG